MDINTIIANAGVKIAKIQEAGKYEGSLMEFTEYVWPVVEPAIPFTRGWAIEAIAEHLEAVTYGQIKRLLINVPPGFTKPARKDQLVQTLRGIIPLSEVVIGDMILTHMGRFRRVVAVHEQGVLPIVRIDTWSGRAIYAAPDHPFLTTRGWIEAGRLDKEDFLAAVAPVEDFGAPIDHREARFLGYLIGDGSVKYASISFTNMEFDVLADFEAIARSYGFKVRTATRPGNKALTLYLSANHTGILQDFLKKHGLKGCDAYSKRIPAAIMNADYATAANFLGAYWSCDGYVAIRHKGNKTAYLAKLTTVGEGLAKDIQILGLRLGINLRIRKRVAKLQSKRQGSLYVSYDLEATNQNEVAKIAKLPGLCARKAAAIADTRPRSFGSHLMADPVVSVTEDQPADCCCLTVEEDHSFVCGGVAAKNSLLTDVTWPAWEWGPRNMPWLRYMCASYANYLTERDNMRCRNIVISDRYKRMWGSRFQISNEQFTKVKFANDQTGWKLATSVGGIGTGERADRVIVDDPNNPLEMESEAIRNNAIVWFTEVIPDRLNNPQDSVILVIQQRTHEDDISGTAISRDMGYTHLMIPMEYDPSRHCVTVLGMDELNQEVKWEDPRKVDGELAWPERFTQKVSEDLKRDKGPYAWCSSGEAPVLMGDLSLKPICEIQKGDKIAGFTIGNNKKRARLKPAEVLSISISHRPIVKMTLSSGEVIRCTPDHRWWTGRNDKSHAPYAPAKIGTALSRVCPPRLPHLTDPDDLRLAGWLSGFFDGEGTVSANFRREGEMTGVIGFSQGTGRNRPLCDKLEFALNHFGFNFSWWDKPPQGESDDGHKVRSYWLKMAKEGRASRLPLYQRFLHLVKPAKWRDQIIDSAINGRLYTGSERVISIQPDGIETVYGLETTTGNYVVWGLASSNSGQYMQSPEPRGGSIIKRHFWQVWDQEKFPGFEYILGSLDTAYTAKEENDASALTIWGVFRDLNMNPKMMLIWAWQERLEFHELFKKIVDTCVVGQIVKPFPQFPVDRLLIESKASGQSIGQELHRLFWGTGKLGIELINPTVYGDKVARVHAIQHLFADEMIYAPDRAFADMVIDQCVVADTKIITRFGIKRMDEIQVGDLVLTHKGRFRQVLGLRTRLAEQTITLEPKNLSPLTITEEHPVYALDITAEGRTRSLDWVPAGKIKARRYNTGKRGLEATPSRSHALTLPIIRPEIPIFEIDLREWAKLPSGKKYELIYDDEMMTTSHWRSQWIKWKQPLDHRFGRVIGLYLAEGSGRRSQAHWSFNAKETAFIQEIRSFLSERLGVGSHIYTANGATTVSANLPLLEDFLGSCGRLAHNKRVPEWVWDAPDEFCRGLLDGYMDGDGWEGKVGGKTVVRGTTVSLSLAYGIRLLAMRMGHHATVRLGRRAGTMNFRGRIARTRDSYVIEWRSERVNNGASIPHKDVFGYSVMKITIQSGPAQVYNMEVVEDNSYCTTGGLVHNCAVFPKGSRDDLVDSTSQALRYLRDAGFALKREEYAVSAAEDMLYKSPSSTMPLYQV